LLVIAEPGSGGNLAWGKATSQSSTSFGGNSSRGVDGNTNGNWGDNSVTHTNNEHQPWWQVDLGSVQQIGTVKLWNRTDCCGERLSNFYVLVSDNPFSSTDLTTTINQAGVSNYYTAGPAGLLTEVGVGRSGRYVRVQLAGDNYLQLAEVEVMAGTASGAGPKWLMTDHLGSTRMVIDQTGSLGGVRRHDFAPFGEELFAGAAIRSESNGYSGDSVRQKFDGYERDSETGLDFAEARYFGSIMGRFTSPDDFHNDSDVSDPQSWNKYAFVRNNPLRFIDPTGKKATVAIRYDPSNNSASIVISASFAVYSGDGQLSKDELQKQADLLKKQIESAYSGSFTENGITFTVSANVTTQVLSESEAIKLGNDGKIDNLVSVLNRETFTVIQADGTSSNNNAGGTENRGEKFDRMTIAGKNSGIQTDNIYPHEFGHGLGFIGHLGSGNLMQRYTPAAPKLTQADFTGIFGNDLKIYRYTGCHCFPNKIDKTMRLVPTSGKIQ
jgi:RHS repeat-associated protein